MSAVYEWLKAMDGQGDVFDRHIFACALAAGVGDPARVLTEALGLAPDALTSLIEAYFPQATELLAGLPGEAPFFRPQEESLQHLLLAQATAGGRAEERWLATILARRSQLPGTLWTLLGLPAQRDLTRVMTRHFLPLAAGQGSGVDWKKLLRRLACFSGSLALSAQDCDRCHDFMSCFGLEEEQMAGVGMFPISTLSF